MRFISTRGGFVAENAAQAITKGLSEDGGLFVPESFPDVSSELENMLSMDYAERAAFIIGKYLEDIVRKEIGCKVRSIELNVMQRCSSHICSKTDIDEAEEIGSAGVRCALAGDSGKVMIFRRVSDAPYAVVIDKTDASNIANNEKYLPDNFITPAKNNISDIAIPYFMPLIQGEPNLIMKNGIPRHFAIHESLLK